MLTHNSYDSLPPKYNSSTIERDQYAACWWLCIVTSQYLRLLFYESWYSRLRPSEYEDCTYCIQYRSKDVSCLTINVLRGGKFHWIHCAGNFPILGLSICLLTILIGIKRGLDNVPNHKCRLWSLFVNSRNIQLYRLLYEYHKCNLLNEWICHSTKHYWL